MKEPVFSDHDACKPVGRQVFPHQDTKTTAALEHERSSPSLPFPHILGRESAPRKGLRQLAQQEEIGKRAATGEKSSEVKTNGRAVEGGGRLGRETVLTTQH